MTCARCQQPVKPQHVCLREHPEEWTHERCCAAEHDAEAQR